MLYQTFLLATGRWIKTIGETQTYEVNPRNFAKLVGTTFYNRIRNVKVEHVPGPWHQVVGFHDE
jgi:hypothetical protein